MTGTNVLHRKYRPPSFDEVLGQDHVIGPLQKAIKDKRFQVFLFGGPSGVGKTSLARICAHELGCEDADIIEIDAATCTGIDAMRKVQEAAQYRSFNPTGVRAVIIDESHALSRQAFQSLLKTLEEPPAHSYWFLCTTEASKIPQTIKTRLAPFMLNALDETDIEQLLEFIVAKEKLDIKPDIVSLIAHEAAGSARQALVYLAMCDGAKNRQSAAKLIKSALTSDPTIELCRMLVNDPSWPKAVSLMNKLTHEAPESVRIIVCNYLATVLKKTTQPEKAVYLLTALDAFSQPYNQSEGAAPLLLSIGKVVFSGEGDA